MTTIKENRIPINMIRPADEQNVRSSLPEIKKLSKSIDVNGLLEPIVVTNGGSEKQPYKVVAGDRRLAACKLLGWKDIPVVFRDYKDAALGSAQKMIDNIIENIEREDVNNIDMAQRIHDLLTGEYPADEGEKRHVFTPKELCESLGKSPAYVSNMKRICELICAPVKREARKFSVKMPGGDVVMRLVPQKLLFDLAGLVKTEKIRVKKTDEKGNKVEVEEEVTVSDDAKQVKLWGAWKAEQEALAAEGKEVKRRGRAKKGKKGGDGEGEGEGLVKGAKKRTLLSCYRTVLESKQGSANKEESAVIAGRIEVVRFVLGELKRLPGVTKEELEAAMTPDSDDEDEAAE